MPLEVIAGQDRSQAYAELSRDFIGVINEGIAISRAALDAAGFAVVPKETAKRDLEECLRQNGYAIDLVQRNERLQEALDEWERMARQEAKEWNDKHI